MARNDSRHPGSCSLLCRNGVYDWRDSGLIPARIKATAGPLVFDRVNELSAQLGRLPVEQREVLILATVEELRYDEFARLLSVPVGTVMSRLSRARERLRRMVGAPPSPL